MEKILYSPGDRVVVHDNSGPAERHVTIGQILTIKKKMRSNGASSTYYFEEIKCCLAARRFEYEKPPAPIEYRRGDKVIVTRNVGKAKIGTVLVVNRKQNDDMYSFGGVRYCLREQSFKYYHPDSDEHEGKYDGWVNAATAEAAIVFFNDSSRIAYVKEQLISLSYVSVRQAAMMIRNTDINGSHQDVCIRAILENWVTDSYNNKEMNDSRRQLILNKLGSHFDYLNPSLEDQAQAQAITAAERFPAHQEFVASLLPKPEPEITHIMKIETKYFVNDVNINNYTTDEKVSLIKETEDKIAELKKVKTKSKMVDAEIDKLEAFLIKAVELFDAE